MSALSTFEVGPYLFGVEVELVQEIVRIDALTPVPLAPPAVGGLINLRGEVITAIDLRRRLGLPGRAPGRTLHVVLRLDGEPTSLTVDTIGGVVQVRGLPFDRTPPTAEAAMREAVTGAYTLPDRLLLALDVRAMLLGSDATPAGPAVREVRGSHVS